MNENLGAKLNAEGLGDLFGCGLSGNRCGDVGL